MKTMTCLSLIVFVSSLLFPVFAEQNNTQTLILQAKADAERDASNNFNQWLWLIGGGCAVVCAAYGGGHGGYLLGKAMDPPTDDCQCLDLPSVGMVLGGLIGMGLGPGCALSLIYTYTPVPSERLIGKSPEYVEMYTKAYKRKAGFLQAANAGIGSCLGVAAIGAIGAAMSSNE